MIIVAKLNHDDNIITISLEIFKKSSNQTCLYIFYYNFFIRIFFTFRQTDYPHNTSVYVDGVCNPKKKNRQRVQKLNYSWNS